MLRNVAMQLILGKTLIFRTIVNVDINLLKKVSN